MSYQVLARKWRPQQFDDVIGQPAVTRTLANAITSGRIAQSFVFAGPRGVGKTTTARILARALNCEKGPTAQPCGTCDACREITDGRPRHRRHGDGCRHAHADRQRARGDHPGAVDHAGEKPVQGLHHRRGPPAFEPFVQRAVEIDRRAAAARRVHDGDDGALKIPETVLSRSQVFEFKTISSRRSRISFAGLPTRKKLLSTIPRCC